MGLIRAIASRFRGVQEGRSPSYKNSPGEGIQGVRSY